MNNAVDLWTANERRHIEHTPQQVDTARRALPYARSDAQREALRLRIIHPTATLTDLALLSDPPLSKDAYWSRLRLGMLQAR